jgi:hypothetical protein
VIILSLTGINSCKKDIIQNNDQNLNQAKEWFNAQHLPYQPVWDKKEIFKSDSVTVLLVPSGYVYDANQNQITSKLVFRLKGDHVEGSMVELFNNKSVLNVSENDQLYTAVTSTILADLPASFSGDVLQFTVDHSFIKGWQVAKGIVSNSIQARKKAVQDGDTHVNVIDHVLADCADWYFVTYNVVTGEIYSSTYMYTDCGFLENIGGAGGGSSGVSVTVPTVQSFLNKIDDSNLSPCMKAILAAIKNLSNGSVVGIIQKFAGETPGYNWTMKEGVLPQYVNGQTSPFYNSATGTVTTVFDSQKFTNASDLAITTTILHESVHSYLVAYFHTDPINGNNSNTTAYPDLLKDLEKTKHPNFNDLQHNEMIRNFMDDISKSLQEYSILKGYLINDPNYFKDMAWGGLTTDKYGNLTPLFLQLVPNSTDRDRISNLLSSEQTGYDLNNNYKGIHGTLSGCQ